MEQLGKVVAIIIAAVIVLAAFYAVAGWLVMIAVGVVKSIFDWPKTISFIQGVQLAWIITLVGGLFNFGSTAKRS